VLIDTASLPIAAVIDRLLLPCQLHRLLVCIVELGRGSSGSLIGSVSIGLVTAVSLLVLLTLLHIVLLVAVVALPRATISTVPRVLAEALVQVEQVVARASVPTCNLLLCVSTVWRSSLADLRGALITRCSILHIRNAR